MRFDFIPKGTDIASLNEKFKEVKVIEDSIYSYRQHLNDRLQEYKAHQTYINTLKEEC
tara:strand:- start:375 stop:548 length:174 start_codon:yes stop_codon:yes gene_type:complete